MVPFILSRTTHNLSVWPGYHIYLRSAHRNPRLHPPSPTRRNIINQQSIQRRHRPIKPSHLCQQRHPLGHRRAPPPLHSKLRRHHRPPLLHPRLRNPLHPPPLQDHRPRPKLLQHIRHRHQHHHAEDAEPHSVGVGCQGRLLLGRHRGARAGMVVVAVAGDEGEDVCAARCSVPEQDEREEVQGRAAGWERGRWGGGQASIEAVGLGRCGGFCINCETNKPTININDTIQHHYSTTSPLQKKSKLHSSFSILPHSPGR